MSRGELIYPIQFKNGTTRRVENGNGEFLFAFSFPKNLKKEDKEIIYRTVVAAMNMAYGLTIEEMEEAAALNACGCESVSS